MSSYLLLAVSALLNSPLGVVGVCWAHWLEVWARNAGLHSNPGMEIITSSVRNLGPDDLFIALSTLMNTQNSVSDEDLVGGMLWRYFICFIDAGMVWHSIGINLRLAMMRRYTLY